MITPNLDDIYKSRFTEVLKPLSEALRNYLVKDLSIEDLPRVDRVMVRPKSIKSFLDKCENLNKDGNKKYNDPLNQIQDQIGARIVVYYSDDIERMREFIERYFGFVEKKRIIPEKENEFGYEGVHFILFFPKDVINEELERHKDEIPEFFELQIKTLFQHAWAQADHNLAYKPQIKLTSDERRRVAFTAAQAWGADYIFNELWMSLKKNEC